MNTPLELDKKARSIGFSHYLDYLANSARWHLLRLTLTGKTCYCCGEWKAFWLLLHHISYERLGRELPEDVITLCRWCHDRCHELIWTKKATLQNAHILVKAEMDAERLKGLHQPRLPLEAA